MIAEATSTKAQPTNTGEAAVVPPKPTNPAAVKKAIALGKEMSKQPEVTKADVARKMYELISTEPREIIVEAFVEGAALTPKGAQTYFYNCKRKSKSSN